MTDGPAPRRASLVSTAARGVLPARAGAAPRKRGMGWLGPGLIMAAKGEV
jgi:hypothetical protein